MAFKSAKGGDALHRKAIVDQKRFCLLYFNACEIMPRCHAVLLFEEIVKSSPCQPRFVCNGLNVNFPKVQIEVLFGIGYAAVHVMIGLLAQAFKQVAEAIEFTHGKIFVGISCAKRALDLIQDRDRLGGVFGGERKAFGFDRLVGRKMYGVGFSQFLDIGAKIILLIKKEHVIFAKRNAALADLMIHVAAKLDTDDVRLAVACLPLFHRRCVL